MKKAKATIKEFSKRSSFEFLFFSTAITLFVNLSIATIDKFSIWFDEAFGAFLIRFNFFDIAKYTAYDVHPPFYYWALKIWSMIFGNSQISLRLMSVFFGVVAMLFIYLLVRRLFGKKAAICSIFLVAISPFFIKYAQEARMYTLVLALAFAATYALVIAMSSKKKVQWVIYGILIALGMLTHYFLALVWLTHWIWRFDDIRRTTPRKQIIKTFFSKEWVMAHCVAITLFLFWIPWLFMQVFVVQAYGFWIPPVTLNTLTNFVNNLFFYKEAVDTPGWLALSVLILISSLVFIGIKVYKKIPAKNRTNFRLILFMTVIPILLLFLISMPPMRPYFIDRYLFVSVISFSVFAAIILSIGLSLIKTKTKYLIPLLLVFVFAVGISNVYQIGNFNKNTKNSNNANEIVRLVSEQSLLGEPIIVDNQYFFYEVVFYESDNHKVYFMGSEIYQGSTKMLENEVDHKISDLDKFIKDNPVIWYVGRPGTGDFKVPFNCKPLNTITLNDTVTNQPAYKAVRCHTAN